MSDATQLIGEIQDLATAVGEVADAVRSTPAPEAPVVTVNVPEQPPPQVTVNVAPADQPAPQVTVNVPQQAAPIVNVAATEVKLNPKLIMPPVVPNSYEVRIIERDAYGYIVAFTITPQ